MPKHTTASSKTPVWNVALHPDATANWTTPTGATLHTDPVNLLTTTDPLPGATAPSRPSDLLDRMAAPEQLSPLKQHLAHHLAAA